MLRKPLSLAIFSLPSLAFSMVEEGKERIAFIYELGILSKIPSSLPILPLGGPWVGAVREKTYS